MPAQPLPTIATRFRCIVSLLVRVIKPKLARGPFFDCNFVGLLELAQRTVPPAFGSYADCATRVRILASDAMCIRTEIYDYAHATQEGTFGTCTSSCNSAHFELHLDCELNTAIDSPRRRHFSWPIHASHISQVTHRDLVQSDRLGCPRYIGGRGRCYS